MFFRRRRRYTLFRVLLALFGLRFMAGARLEGLSAEEREHLRDKRRRFRRKIRDAFDVWDEEDAAPAAADSAE